MKSNTKLWFDIALNAIQYCNKHYKKFKQSGRKTDKDNFKYARLSLKKLLIVKKNFYFEDKIAENKNSPKELWRTLKSLGMSPKGGRQWKISLKENVVVSFDPKKNANIFCRFFSNSADSLLLKLPRPKNKFGIKTTTEYYKEIHYKCEDFVFHNVDITSVEKILKNLDVAKASGIDQISTRFLKDGAPVIAIHLPNIINLSIKLDKFPSQCKIAKIKPLFKKGIKTKAKNYRPISVTFNIEGDRKIHSLSNARLPSKK